jgi:hypothetical protein
MTHVRVTTMIRAAARMALFLSRGLCTNHSRAEVGNRQTSVIYEAPPQR